MVNFRKTVVVALFCAAAVLSFFRTPARAVTQAAPSVGTSTQTEALALAKKAEKASHIEKASKKIPKNLINKSDVKESFWRGAPEGKGVNIIDYLCIAAGVAKVPVKNLAANNYVEGSFKFNPGSYYGAKGPMQIFDNTFVTYVAEYGNDTNVREALAAYCPKAAKIIARVMPEIPRDPKTGAFLFKRLSGKTRNDILSIRKLGGADTFLTEIIFAAMGMAGMRREMEKLGVKPEEMVYRWGHKYSNPKKVSALLRGLQKDRTSGSKLSSLEKEALKFSQISEEICKHLLSFHGIRAEVGVSVNYFVNGMKVGLT